MKKTSLISIAMLVGFATLAEVPVKDSLYIKMLTRHFDDYYGERQLLQIDTVYLDNNLEVFNEDLRIKNVTVILIHNEKDLRERLRSRIGNSIQLIRVSAIDLCSPSTMCSSVISYSCGFSDLEPGLIRLGPICSSLFRIEYSCANSSFLLLTDYE